MSNVMLTIKGLRTKKQLGMRISSEEEAFLKFYNGEPCTEEERELTELWLEKRRQDRKKGTVRA